MMAGVQYPPPENPHPLPCKPPKNSRPSSHQAVVRWKKEWNNPAGSSQYRGEATDEDFGGKEMAASQLNKIIQQLRTTLVRRNAAGDTDADLLQRYLQQRDETAFEVLLQGMAQWFWGCAAGAGQRA